MEYGLDIFNADGVPIVSPRFRNLEAISWGTMSLVNRNNYRLDIPDGFIAPIVFVKPQSLGWIVRGFPKTDGAGRHVNFSADRNMNVDYVIAGFRTGDDPDATDDDYGHYAWDEQGRLCFSTDRPYVRLPYRSITLQTLFQNPSRTMEFGMISGGSPAYQHPAWGANDYFHWGPFPFYSKDAGANWHYGLWFGDATPYGVANTRFISVTRVDLSTSLAGADLGFGPTGPPGLNLVPNTRLSCNFVPPS